MLRRFFKQSLVPKSTLTSSLSSSSVNPLKSYKSIPKYNSLYPVTLYNFSTISLIKGSYLQDSTISSEQIKAFKDKVSSAGLEESASFLAQTNNFSYSPYHNSDLFDIYKAVEAKWNQGSYHFAKPQLVLLLSNVFAAHKLGGKKFWENLSERFGTLVGMNVYSFHEIALFTYNVTKFKEAIPEYWELIEKKIVENGPSVLSGDTVAMLLAGYYRSFARTIAPKAKNFNSKEDMNAMDLDSHSLWVVLRDLAIKKVPNLSTSALLSVVEIFKNVKVPDGFWLDAEERFNEIVHRFSAREVSMFAQILGSIKKGTANFWNDIEKYTLGSIKILEDDELANFVVGFAANDQGTIKFWDATQNYTLQNLNKFTSRSLSMVVYGFSTAEINKTRLWDALQERVTDMISKIQDEDLHLFIKGFAFAKRGDEGFWAVMEERVLNMEHNSFVGRFLVYNELNIANRVTPKLANHFRDVSDFANYYSQMQEDGQQKQETSREERAQVRNL